MTETRMVLSDSDLTINLNLAKEVLIHALMNDGVIDSTKFGPEDLEKLQASYVLIVKKKGLFGKVFDKVFGNDTSETYIVALRSKL